jgi:tetratricopeptide (TPR) repeat protein
LILASARLLEALAASALDTVNLPWSTSLFSNLDSLQQFNLIPRTTRYWAHALRRMGNDVRHVCRLFQPRHAELASLFAELSLCWFFCRFRFGPRLSSLTRDHKPLGLSCDQQLRHTAEVFEATGFDPLRLARQWASGRGPDRVWSPVFAAALVEELLDRKHYDEAAALLRHELDRFPDDLRLKQLQGLYWSRLGELDRARDWLEPVYQQYNNDDETIGITAGVYKRLWVSDKSQQQWLCRAHLAYFAGWRMSRRKNAYLGINAATTALWLRRHDDMTQIAKDVLTCLRQRQGALAMHHRDPDLVLNYWDWVTLAEACLLLGDLQTARTTYQEAFQRHSDQTANIEVTRKQAEEILQAMCVSQHEAAEWFD